MRKRDHTYYSVAASISACSIKAIVHCELSIVNCYTPTGQRQTKTTNHLSLTTNHFYFHDATGNVMCIYEQQGDTLTAIECAMYGSKRLGVLTQKVEIGHNGTLLSYNHNTIGTRTYELTDHLGNVTAIILDRKILGTDSVYRPVVVSFTDYYPFGYPMSERSWRLDGYRYGFNGQESDGEVYGEKSMFGYEFRQYDSRLGRWWGIDRERQHYSSVSTYCYSLNNPILFSDENGKWVRDQSGNIIVTIDNKLSAERGGKYITGSANQQIVLSGNWGYIMANDGTKIEVFIPTSTEIILYTIDNNGNTTNITDISSMYSGDKNCTSNSLLPNTPNIVISSDQITEEILETEGFIKGKFIQENIDEIGLSGDPVAKSISVNNLTNAGDIITYSDLVKGKLIFTHFEIFLNQTIVDTKGGVQKGPIKVKPGENKFFENPTLWFNLNINGWQDTSVSLSPNEKIETSNGKTIISNEKFNEIRNEIK